MQTADEALETIYEISKATPMPQKWQQYGAAMYRYNKTFCVCIIMNHPLLLRPLYLEWISEITMLERSPPKDALITMILPMYQRAYFQEGCFPDGTFCQYPTRVVIS